MTADPTEPHADLQRILEITRLMAATNDLRRLLQLVIDRSMELLDAERASLFLHDADSDELVSYIAAGEGEIRFPADRGIAGATFRGGATIHVPDAYADPRFNQEVDRHTGFHTRNVVSVPLRDHEGELIGVLQVLNKRPGAFSDQDLRLAETLSAQAGVALQRARLIERYVESQRLAAIGQTVAGLAHCVKNILNGVRGGEYILDRALEAHDEDRCSRGWALLKRNIAFLSDLVLDMLAYAKQRTPARAPVDPRDLLEQIRDLAGVRGGERGITVACEVAEDVQTVELDSTAMKRCLLNLAGNAVDACGEQGGQVLLRCERAPDGQAVRFAVCDDGCGIPPEHLEQLFDMFFSTKGSKGTGLGLAVSQKIVQEHGGVLRVESTVGEGTTFTIEIPTHP
jgi:signal transduction histidine kinase